VSNLTAATEDLAKLVEKIRCLCRRIEKIDEAIGSEMIDAAILPEYIRERNQLESELKRILTAVMKTS